RVKPGMTKTPLGVVLPITTQSRRRESSKKPNNNCRY
ncbi:MAG: hypothetical protein JSV83_04150, partial [Desulfobacterales bacterium]